MLSYALLLLRNPIAATAIARTISNITGCGRVRLAVLGAGAAPFANSIGILSCGTATVLGSKRHCEYACSAAPSSCWFPVLVSIRAPVTLPVCLSIVTKTTPFPVSPCFAHSARYTGLGVWIALGGGGCPTGLARCACSDETETRLTTMAGRTLRISDGRLQTWGAPTATSITAAGEEGSAIRASVARAVNDGARKFICQATRVI